MIRIGLFLVLCLWTLAAGAQDFRCETREGRVMRLSELPQDRLTLLVFYDPDCTDCRQELFGMKHSGMLRQAVREGRVQVMAVYAEADEALWRETCQELPDTWTVAIARDDIHAMKCYDLSGMPAIYILNRYKEVVLADADLYQLADLLKKQ